LLEALVETSTLLGISSGNSSSGRDSLVDWLVGLEASIQVLHLGLDWKEFEFNEERTANIVVVEELDPAIETVVDLAKVVEGDFSRTKGAIDKDVFVVNVETKNGGAEVDIVESEVAAPTWVSGLVLADVSLFNLAADGNLAIWISFIKKFLLVLELS